MTQFWIITSIIFIVITFVLALLTLKKFKNEEGDKIWRLNYGRSTYWQIITLCSFGITFILMLILKQMSLINF